MTWPLIAAKMEEEAASSLRLGFSICLFLRKGYGKGAEVLIAGAKSR
jgi:hypothetical protein